MKRGGWAALNAFILCALVAFALAALNKTGVNVPAPALTLPPATWQPVTLGMAVMLADYADREDWSGCETQGSAPLLVRCPDGWTLEVK